LAANADILASCPPPRIPIVLAFLNIHEDFAFRSDVLQNYENKSINWRETSIPIENC
jgi:hypothetical protein